MERAVVFFCRHLLSPIASVFGSGTSYAARTFLSRHPLLMELSPATSQSTAFAGKVTNKVEICQGKGLFLLKTVNKNERFYRFECLSIVQ